MARKIHPNNALEVAVRKLHAARKGGDRHEVKVAQKGLDNARRALKRIRKAEKKQSRAG